tara:strand:- start:8150 stop:9325 length:1176 start_codon:yes stop_codon:yes gene_type:complete
MDINIIVSNISWKFLKGLLQFFSMILIVRSLDISEYGWYVMAISSFELIAMFCLPGVIKIALRSSLANDGNFQKLLGLRFVLMPFLLFGFIFVPDVLAIYILIAVFADHISMFARVKLNHYKRYFLFNFLESLVPLLLVIFISFYVFVFEQNFTLEILVFAYCLISLFSMMLSIITAIKVTDFSIFFQLPSLELARQSLYASGNGLISQSMRRGAVVIAATFLSVTEAAYVNIALQFLTIFTMIYSGFSLSLTRDIYDMKIPIKSVINNYSKPLLILILLIIFCSIGLFLYGEALVTLIFGIKSIKASSIVFMTPLILLFQLPQLILMSFFMRLKRELIILKLNISSIVIFIPISLIFSTSIFNLILILIAFALFTSLIYVTTMMNINKDN